MKKLEILPYLSRPDKWYLGGGNRLLWAPPFPAYLDSPGFWDEAQYYNYELKPLFTWTLLDEEGSEIVLDFQRRSWKPSVLAQEYLGQLRTSKSALRIMESKVVLPSDVAASVVRILNPSGKTRRLQFVAWTVQDIEDLTVSRAKFDLLKKGKTTDEYYAYTELGQQFGYALVEAVGQVHRSVDLL